MANTLCGTKYSDLCYGYNAFRREAIAAFALPDAHDTSIDAVWGDGFEIETLINVRVAKQKLKITEVGSFEYPRISGESNLRTFRDGWRVLFTIVRERVTRTKLADHVDRSTPVVVGLPAQRSSLAERPVVEREGAEVRAI